MKLSVELVVMGTLGKIDAFFFVVILITTSQLHAQTAIPTPVSTALGTPTPDPIPTPIITATPTSSYATPLPTAPPYPTPGPGTPVPSSGASWGPMPACGQIDDAEQLITFDKGWLIELFDENEFGAYHNVNDGLVAGCFLSNGCTQSDGSACAACGPQMTTADTSWDLYFAERSQRLNMEISAPACQPVGIVYWTADVGDVTFVRGQMVPGGTDDGSLAASIPESITPGGLVPRFVPTPFWRVVAGFTPSPATPTPSPTPVPIVPPII